MIQYSLLGRTAASIRLNTTFRGLAPSPSSGKTDLAYNSSVPCFSTCRGRENQTGFVVPKQLSAPEKTILNHVAAKVLKLKPKIFVSKLFKLLQITRDRRFKMYAVLLLPKLMYLKFHIYKQHSVHCLIALFAF
jgi:hypothetical protein